MIPPPPPTKKLKTLTHRKQDAAEARVFASQEQKVLGKPRHQSRTFSELLNYERGEGLQKSLPVNPEFRTMVRARKD